MAFARLLDARYNCVYSQCVRADETYVAYAVLNNRIFTMDQMRYVQICFLTGDVLDRFMKRNHMLVPTENLVVHKDFVVIKEYENVFDMGLSEFHVDVSSLVSIEQKANFVIPQDGKRQRVR